MNGNYFYQEYIKRICVSQLLYRWDMLREPKRRECVIWRALSPFYVLSDSTRHQECSRHKVFEPAVPSAWNTHPFNGERPYGQHPPFLQVSSQNLLHEAFMGPFISTCKCSLTIFPISISCFIVLFSIYHPELCFYNINHYTQNVYYTHIDAVY